MQPPQDRQSLIDLLVEHEKGMEMLYRLSGEKFPYQREFFLSLAEEEKRHAKAITEIRPLLVDPAKCTDNHRIKVAPLRTSLTFLKREIEASRVRRQTLVEALSVALDFERSLIEKRFYEVFQGDAELVRTMLTGLAEETGQHVRRIQTHRDEIIAAQKVTRVTS